MSVRAVGSVMLSRDNESSSALGAVNYLDVGGQSDFAGFTTEQMAGHSPEIEML